MNILSKLLPLLTFALISSSFFYPKIAFASLTQMGPVDQTSGFPRWFQDENGIALDLMEASDIFSISDPVDPNNSFSHEIGFNAEGFWWSAEASAAGDGIDALVVNALEAAFAGEEAVDGEQSVFGRVRFRIDVPVPGEYVVKHPFGTETFIVDEVDDGPEIRNVGVGGGEPDIGCFAQAGLTSCDPNSSIGSTDPRFNFSAVLQSHIGPFLTWDTFDLDPELSDPLLINPLKPERRYVGNPAVEHTIKGSPVGQNFFEVSGPNGIKARTQLFVVSGRLADLTPPQINEITTNPSIVVATTSTVLLNVAATDDMTGVLQATADFSEIAGTITQLTLISGTPTNGVWQTTISGLSNAGIFNVSITVIDGGGNSATENFSLHILNPPPVLVEEISVPEFTSSTNPSYTFSSDQNGTITYIGQCLSIVTSTLIGSNTIILDNEGQPLSEGTYSNCSITVTNSDGLSSTLEINEFTIDLTPPVITILGDDPILHNLNTPFTDPGALALDNFNGDITNLIISSSTVDSNTAGNYLIAYDVVDLAGNSATSVERIVKVGAASEITIHGFNPFYIPFGSEYNDPGASSTDALDGDITPSVNSTVDTNNSGNYAVNYLATNSQGFSSSSTRSVIVYSPISSGAINATSTSPTSNEISWGSSSGGIQPYFYKIFRDSVLLTTTSLEIYLDSGLTPSTSYSYTIVTVDSLPANQLGPGTASTSISVTTLPDVDSPSAPENLSGSAISASQINLNWTSSTDNVKVSEYWIYRNMVSSTIISTTTPTVKSTQNLFADTGLNPSTSYTYMIAAVDSSGNISGLSNEITISTHALPSPVVSGGSGGGGFIPVSGGGAGLSAPLFTLPVPSMTATITPIISENPISGAVLGVRISSKDQLGIDGQLIRSSDSAVYILSGGKKKLLSSRELSLHSGQNILDVEDNLIDSFATISSLPRNSATFENGTLLRSRTSFKIYILENGKKRYISTLAELRSLGSRQMYNVSDDSLNLFENAEKILTTPATAVPTTILGYKEGTLLRSRTSFKIYILEKGKKRYISTLAELRSLGRRQMYNVSDQLLSRIPE